MCTKTNGTSCKGTWFPRKQIHRHRLSLVLGLITLMMMSLPWKSFLESNRRLIRELLVDFLDIRQSSKETVELDRPSSAYEGASLFSGAVEPYVSTEGPDSVSDRQRWCQCGREILTWTEGGWDSQLSQLRCLPVQMDQGWDRGSMWEREELGSAPRLRATSILPRLSCFLWISCESENTATLSQCKTI